MSIAVRVTRGQMFLSIPYLCGVHVKVFQELLEQEGKKGKERKDSFAIMTGTSDLYYQGHRV